MLLIATSSPFGSRSRSRILIALRFLDYSYPRALARLLDIPIFAVRKALAALERDGLVCATAVGRTRVYRLDEAYHAHAELASYLSRLADLDDDLRARLATTRGAATASLARPAEPTSQVGTVRAPSATSSAAGKKEARHAAGDGWRNW